MVSVESGRSDQASGQLLQLREDRRTHLGGRGIGRLVTSDVLCPDALGQHRGNRLVELVGPFAKAQRVQDYFRKRRSKFTRRLPAAESPFSTGF